MILVERADASIAVDFACDWGIKNRNYPSLNLIQRFFKAFWSKIIGDCFLETLGGSVIALSFLEALGG